jgi:predicted Zn-dependent protease
MGERLREASMSVETQPTSRRTVLAGLGATAAAGVVTGCEHNPHLGRSQLILVSDEELTAAGEQTWRQMRRQQRRADDPAMRRQVERIGGQIAQSSNLTGLNWEFDVFEGPPNAFVLPGGKVGYFTGMRPLADNDAKVANILGHEAAHVASRHSAERMSQHMLASAAVGVASAFIAGAASNQRQASILAGLLGAGVTYGILMPYSRQHEYEADALGLRFMANAGYDPQEAPKFWQAMERESQRRGSPPEFLSTHPSDAARVAALNERMPEAMQLYTQRRRTS